MKIWRIFKVAFSGMGWILPNGETLHEANSGRTIHADIVRKNYKKFNLRLEQLYDMREVTSGIEPQEDYVLTALALKNNAIRYFKGSKLGIEGTLPALRANAEKIQEMAENEELNLFICDSSGESRSAAYYDLTVQKFFEIIFS